MASSTAADIQNPRRRWGAGGVGGAGAPLPSGAGATPQPPGSRMGGGGDPDLDVSTVSLLFGGTRNRTRLVAVDSLPGGSSGGRGQP